MRCFVVILIAACASPPPPAPVKPPAPVATVAHEAFTPTSFSVKVSGSGRPVILIPGLGCPGEVWDDTVKHFAGHAETHVLTLAGMAGQPAIAGPLNATARDELARYIADRKLDHPVVIGHSMGGFLAFWLAAENPDLVGPTIVVDALPALGVDTDAAQARQIADGWKADTPAEFAQSTHDFFSMMAFNTQKLAPVMTAVAHSDRRAFADAFYELFTTDIRPELAQIRAPVLLVLAESAPLDLAQQQTASIAVHETVVIPNTRHFVFFDDPPGFFEVVDSFLTAHPNS